jgi:hypothetical protein
MKKHTFLPRVSAGLAFVAVALIGSPSAKADVFTSWSSFLSRLQGGYYFEDLSRFPAGYLSSPQDFSGGTPAFTYTVSYAVTHPEMPDHGLYVVETPGYGKSLSVVENSDNIHVSFTSGNVTAVGGYFFMTDYGGNVTGGTVTVRLSDGSTARLYSPNDPAGLFRGFISTVPITSLDIQGAEDPSPNAPYVTVSSLTVGVPEPGTLALAALGLLTLGVWRWRCSK